MPGSGKGAQRGTPHKRVLFGSDGQNSISSGNDVPEDRSGWPLDNEYPVNYPSIKLENVVL